MDSVETADLTIHTPAQYVIEVFGDIDPSWSDEMSGMQFERVLRKDGARITRLSGQLADQAALAGILYHLYLLRYTILYVKRIAADSPNSQR